MEIMLGLQSLDLLWQTGRVILIHWCTGWTPAPISWSQKHCGTGTSENTSAPQCTTRTGDCHAQHSFHNQWIWNTPQLGFAGPSKDGIQQ